MHEIGNLLRHRRRLASLRDGITEQAEKNETTYLYTRAPFHV